MDKENECLPLSAGTWSRRAEVSWYSFIKHRHTTVEYSVQSRLLRKRKISSGCCLGWFFSHEATQSLFPLEGGGRGVEVYNILRITDKGDNLPLLPLAGGILNTKR